MTIKSSSIFLFILKKYTLQLWQLYTEELGTKIHRFQRNDR